jgi:RNA polymerase sigma factor (sigma-70 family)
MTREELDAELKELAEKRWWLDLMPRSIPEADRREIAQEAFSKLARVNPARIQERANFRSYAARTLRRVVVDWVTDPSSAREHVPATTAVLEKAYFTQGFVPETPDEAYARQQDKELVRRALRELPRRRGQILAMRCLDGFSAREVASLRRSTASSG